MIRVRLLIALAPLVLASGCRSDPVFVEMSDSTYVRAMIALRQLPVGAIIDRAGRERQRDSILKVLGVTGAELESTTVRLAADPPRAADIWRVIEAPAYTAPIPQKKSGA